MTIESPKTLITDAEKTFAFLAQLLDELGNIRRAVSENEFNLDMYGDDPGGVYGIIQGPQKSTTAAPLFTQFNGPYLITSILATWQVGTQTTPAVAQATAAATGNATATLPPGYSVTGFSITPGTAAAGYTAAITVNGAAGGSNPINYALQGSATVAQPLNVNYPQPLTPLSPSTGISLTFTGNANTPSADIIIYGVLDEAATSVTLQLKDRTMQLDAAAGIYNPQGMMVQMDRDDQIILTVTPKGPCHLEIFGQPDERIRNYLHD